MTISAIHIVMEDAMGNLGSKKLNNGLFGLFLSEMSDVKERIGFKSKLTSSLEKLYKKIDPKPCIDILQYLTNTFQITIERKVYSIKSIFYRIKLRLSFILNITRTLSNFPTVAAILYPQD